jgi:hypothetical protein
MVKVIASFFICLSFWGSGFAELIWSGTVNSNGNPSAPIELNLEENYLIEVSGFVNLGKWIQNGEKLANDACFEFNEEKETAKIATMRNSLNISVCNGTYHPDHVYSAKFKAEQGKIHFWVSDNYYNDNSGSFSVKIYRQAPER